MSRQDVDGRPPATGKFDGLCRVVFELALVLAPVVFLLSFLHARLTYHATIDEVLDSHHVRASLPEGARVGVDEQYPAYRFSNDWQDPIGQLRVDSIDGRRVTFSYDPKAFTWPMGKQGTVLSGSPQGIRLSLGSADGLAHDQQLSLFRGRDRIAGIQIEELLEHTSTARLTETSDTTLLHLRDLRGLTVSEFTIATQAVIFNSPELSCLEALVVLGAIGGYLVLTLKWRAPPLLTVGRRIRGFVRPTSKARLIGLGFLGVPVTWYAAHLTVNLLSLCLGHVFVDLIHSFPPDWLTDASLQQISLPLFLMELGGYEVYLWKRRSSPFPALLKMVEFKGGVYGHTASEPSEHLTMWALHFIIAFAFAKTIFGFFQGNLGQAIANSWPHAPAVLAGAVRPFSQDGLSRMGSACWYALTHVPQPANRKAAFATLEAITNNACIAAGLLGYGYSILSYAWGKRIRNLDFTVIGWFTNGVCYGPLFAVALWQMLPGLVGKDPIVTDSPFFTIVLASTLFVNILYTSSIWNLGKMFGVMTDKGVRTTGFYSVVRHPSYTLEPLMFILLTLRGFSTVAQWYAAFFYLVIYWLRSERDDQFMGASNPEYAAYRAKAPDKFLPGIY